MYRITVKLCSLLVITTVLSFDGLAQISEMIISDRPGQAFSSYTVGKNVTQFQMGIRRENLDLGFFESGNTVPNLGVRYGLSHRLELNTSIGYSFSTLEGVAGLSQAEIGARVHLAQLGSGLAISWQNSLLLNILDEDYNQENIGFLSAFSASQGIGNFGVSLVAGILADGNPSETNDDLQINYVINFSYALNPELGVFIEPYGSIINGNFVWYTDGGLYYFLNKDMQLDLSAGLDLEENFEFWFIEAGVSFRIL